MMKPEFLFGAGGGGGGSAGRNIPDNLRSTDSFEALIGVVAGPIKGLTAGGLKNLYVNGVAAEDAQGRSTLTDFSVKLNTGNPASLEPIQLALGGSSGPTQVGQNVNNPSNGQTPGEWRYASIQQTGCDFIDLRFIVQSLYTSDKKGTHNATATLEVELQASGMSTWYNPLSSAAAPAYNSNGINAGTNVFYLLSLAWDGGEGSTTWRNSSGVLAITGKTTSPYVKELRIGVPNTGAWANKTWQVRVRLRERDEYNNGSSNDPKEEYRKVAWESIAGVKTAPIGNTEPWRGLATLQILGKASDQITGVPEIFGIYDLALPKVPPTSVWNSETRTYTGAVWDGATYQLGWTQDPAWLIKNIIEDDLSGVAALAPGSTLNKWDTLEASRWFSERVPDGKGGTHPRYSLNYLFDQPLDIEEAVNYLAGAVNGFAWDQGDGDWRMVVEKPENPVAIFTEENILDEFSYSHTDVDSRFNDITGIYLDEDRLYEETRIRVYDQADIDTNGRRPTTITLVGCSNRQEALRRLYHRLLSSLRETKVVNFATNRQGRLLQQFSIVGVADGSLSERAKKTTGRILSLSGDRKTITLRDPIRLELGIGYAIQLTIPNPDYNPEPTTQPANDSWSKPTKVITLNVTNNASQRGDVYTLYLDAALPTKTPENGNFSLTAPGLPAIPKQYRVLGLKVADDNPEFVSVTAMEVFTAKWAMVDSITEDAINAQVSERIVRPPEPPLDGNILRAELQTIDDVDRVVLEASWRRPAGTMIEGYRLRYNRNDGPLQTVNLTRELNFEIINPEAGNWFFEIRTVDRRGVTSDPLIAYLELSQDQISAIANGLNDAIKQAQQAINAIVSDDIVSAGAEKSTLVQNVTALKDQFDEFDKRYAALGSPSDLTTARNDAYYALQALLDLLGSYNPAWDLVTATTPVNGTSLRNTFSAAAKKIAAFSAAGTNRPGEAALTVYLTNESHTLPADSSGNVTSYAGATTTVVIMSGASDVTDQFQQIPGENPQGLNVPGTFPTFSVTGGLDANEDVATFTFKASGKSGTPFAGKQVQTVFSLTKSKAGAKGDPGYANILPVADWKVDTTGTQGSFIEIGDQGENSIILGIGPTGASEPLWKMVSQDDAMTDGPGAGDGGWNLQTQPGQIDPAKSYRYMVWAKADTNTALYLGTGSDIGGVLNLDGSDNSNAYFWVGPQPSVGKWYLIVGILHGSSYTGGSSGIAGVYDPATGTRISAGYDYKMKPGTGTISHRAYQYYTPTGSTAYFTRPSIEEIGDTTYSIAQLFATVGMTAQQAQAFQQAQERIVAISSDSVLSAGSEKQQAVLDYAALYNEWQALTARYQALGGPADIQPAMEAANVSVSALSTYLGSLPGPWSEVNNDTAIVAATWQNKWGDAYQKIATLRAAITGRKGADAILVSLTGAPQAIRYDQNDQIAVGDIVFTATRQNTANGVTFASKIGHQIYGTAGVTVSGDTLTISAARMAAVLAYNLANFGTAQETIVATVDGVSDTFTVTKVRDGISTEQYTLSSRGSSNDAPVGFIPGLANAGGGGFVDPTYGNSSNGNARSYTVCRRLNGANLPGSWEVRHFDVFGSSTGSPVRYAGDYSGGISGLAQYVADIPAGAVVAVFTYDDPDQGHRDQRILDALYSLGANPAYLNRDFASRSAYTLVGVKGWARGRAYERYDAAGIVQTSFTVTNGVPSSYADEGNLLQVVCDNEAQTLPADAAGNIVSYTGAGGKLRAYFNGYDVTSSTVFATVANPQNLTRAGGGSLVDTSGHFSVDGGFDAAEASASITLRATYNSLTADQIVNITKAAGGASAVTITISGIPQALNFDKDGNATFNGVTVNTVRQNTGLVPQFYFEGANGYAFIGWSEAASLAAIFPGIFSTTGPDNLTFTTHWTVFGALAASGGQAFKVMTRPGTLGVTDTVTFVRVNDGQNGANGTPALGVSAVPESHTVACDADSVPKPGEGSKVSQFKALVGTTDVTGSAGYAVVGNDGCNAAMSGSAVVLSNFVALSGWADVNVSYGGATTTKRVTFNKARDGSPGVAASVAGTVTASSAWTDSSPIATIAVQGAGTLTATTQWTSAVNNQTRTGGVRILRRVAGTTAWNVIAEDSNGVNEGNFATFVNFTETTSGAVVYEFMRQTYRGGTHAAITPWRLNVAWKP